MKVQTINLKKQHFQVYFRGRKMVGHHTNISIKPNTSKAFALGATTLA
ncbi:MAG: hypothetical protein EOO03_12515 [Chitinophagaceae bacterium]|nr:MAG: hypothetical protein EOO03_12515 [Chitinophagaceae bacterium]